MYFTLYGCTRGVSKVTGAPTCAPVFCIHRVIFIYMCTRGTGIHIQYLLYTCTTDVTSFIGWFGPWNNPQSLFGGRDQFVQLGLRLHP